MKIQIFEHFYGRYGDTFEDSQVIESELLEKVLDEFDETTIDADDVEDELSDALEAIGAGMFMNLFQQGYNANRDFCKAVIERVKSGQMLAQSGEEMIVAIGPYNENINFLRGYAALAEWDGADDIINIATELGIESSW